MISDAYEDVVVTAKTSSLEFCQTTAATHEDENSNNSLEGSCEPAVKMPRMSMSDQHPSRRESVEDFLETAGLSGDGTPLKDKSMKKVKDVVRAAKTTPAADKKKLEPFEGSMDYWEQYDPETIQSEGKAVIITGDDLPLESICFLCGSAGREELLYCRVCCESYHPFCLSAEDLPSSTSSGWINNTISLVFFKVVY